MIVDTSECPSNSCMVRMSVTRFEQVSRERGAQRMGADVLIDAGRLGRQFNGALQSVLVEMVPTGLVRARVD